MLRPVFALYNGHEKKVSYICMKIPQTINTTIQLVAQFECYLMSDIFNRKSVTLLAQNILIQ